MKKTFNGLMSLVLLLLALNLNAEHGKAQPPAPGNYCRFGIGVQNGLSGFDLSLLGVGSYLDWSAWRNNQVPEEIKFLNSLKVSDSAYPSSLANIPYLVSQFPGGFWIIGNEPDSEVNYQDHVTAETYADRYYALAKLIRQQDPTATIGFGPVIQPTLIRMYYLDLAIARLKTLAERDGTTASAMIDVFTIHNFLLNEAPLYQYDAQGNVIKSINWGAGVPRGYQAGVWPEPYIISIDNGELWKTHDVATFSDRIKGFRDWMNKRNMRDKALYITEYGSLFPSDGRTGNITVSEKDTADFLQLTIDYMLTAKDPNIGFSADGDRLVQHFTWYSLNENLWRYGGGLYDPDNDNKLTKIGERYINYDPPAYAEAAGLARKPADLYLLDNSFVIIPIGPGSAPGLVNYKVTLRGSNKIASEYRTQTLLELSKNGTVVGQQSLTLPRCSGQGVYSFMLDDLQPGTAITLSAHINLINGVGNDQDSSNDVSTFPITLPFLYRVFQPMIVR